MRVHPRGSHPHPNKRALNPPQRDCARLLSTIKKQKQAKVDVVVETMQDSLQVLLQNDAKLQSLEQASEALTAQAKARGHVVVVWLIGWLCGCGCLLGWWWSTVCGWSLLTVVLLPTSI